MKTNTTFNLKGTLRSTPLLKAVLPLLFLIFSITTNAQCARTTTPPVNFGCNSGDPIDTFTLNSIASPVSPGCSSGSYLYSSLPNWVMLAGQSYNYSVTLGGNIFTQGFAIWIDLNQDGIYSTTEQLANNAPALASNGSIAIPLSAVGGTTTMRLRNNYATTWGNTNTTACDMVTFGETEDYVVTIVPPTPCSGTPATPSVITTPTGLVCSGASANLNFNITYTVLGISYQWQSSTVSAVGPWVNVPTGTTTPTSGTSSAYTATNLTQNVWYQATVTCANSSLSTTSSAGQINIAPTTTNSVPYNEGFEGISFANQLPNCSWNYGAGSASTTCRTYVAAQNQNRIPRSGSKFASFFVTPAGVNYFYTNGIKLDAGVTYSASMFYLTDYYGYINWTDLSMLIGTAQSTTGLVSIASTNGPAAASLAYKELANTFTVGTSGIYYVAIRATSSSGSAQHLNWDDLSITIPCSLNTVSVSLTANSNTICQGASVNITASGANNYLWNTGATTSTISVNPNSTTLYTVVATNTITGCSSTYAQNITVYPTPVVSIFADKTSVCKGSSVNMYAYGASNYLWSSGPSGANVTVSPTIATTYSVIGVNSFGCSANSSLLINVLNLPSINIGSSATQICLGESATLSGSGGVSYVWASNNVLIQAQQAVVMPSQTTAYTLTGTDANGCSNTANTVLTVNGCVGINEVTSALGLNVFPNPSNGEFKIVFNDNSNKTIEVMDLSGRIILSNISANETANLNISHLANGIYYVKVSSNKATEVVKVVKN
jgi:hypothetical protein